MSNPDEYCKSAEECRQQANKSKSPMDREQWLKIAEAWIRLAAEFTPRLGAAR
jgi:hypothetical protein